jgi:hypothetical protein
MHAKTFFFFLKIQYDFFLEILGRMHENKKIILFYFFILIFSLQKLGI